MKKYLPFLNWLGAYQKQHLRGDINAGITVGIMLIPQGLAYAMLAGLPPIYGLYASTIPIFIYGLFGTSRQLAVGPTAIMAIMVGAGLSQFAEIGTTEFITLAILLAMMVGVIQFLMGALRLGFLVNYLSHPVIAGFTSAAAIIIGLSQLKHILGIDVDQGRFHEIIAEVSSGINNTNTTTLLLGVGGIVVVLLLKRINKKIPGSIIIVILGTALVYAFQLNEVGVKIVEVIPKGLNSFQVPDMDWESVKLLLKLALAISFIGFLESIAIAKAVHAKHKDYEISPNQELIGLGLANIVGAFFKAMPVAGGFSRTAVNDQSGAKSGIASLISASLIIVTLLFFTRLFYYLPNAILAAIIMVAVIGLIDIKEAKHLWRTNKPDFVLFIITFICTLFLGIEKGILTGIVFSLLMLIYRVSYPHIAELGRVPNTDHFRNVSRFDDLELYEDKLILRFDAQLYFANIGFLKNYIDKAIEERPDIKDFIFDARTINYIDSSAAHFLFDLVEDFSKKDIKLHLAGVNGPVRDTLSKNDIISLLGADQFYLSVHEAVQAIDANQRPETSDYATQSNT